MDEKLEDLELLNLKLHNEKMGRLDAQLKNTLMQEGMLRQELAAVEAEYKKFQAMLITKYKMSPTDSINIQSGSIKRTSEDSPKSETKEN